MQMHRTPVLQVSWSTKDKLLMTTTVPICPRVGETVRFTKLGAKPDHKIEGLEATYRVVAVNHEVYLSDEVVYDIDRQVIHVELKEV